MNLRADLKDLAGEIDPSAERPRLQVSTEQWPEALARQGIYSYVDEQGVLHFTLGFDRRGNDEPA